MPERKQLESFYESQGPEEIRLGEGSPQRLEFLTAVRYLENYLPEAGHILDNCAGSGVYAFYLAGKGYRVSAGDLVPYNVELMRSNQAGPALEEIYLGDARDQSRFGDASFDAVLCMGALYHLDDPADRKRSVTESLRVLRDGGMFACTYMNRYAVIMNNLTHDMDNLDEIMTFLDQGREGVFYASTPEETTELLAACGVDVLCHVTLDGISAFLHHTTGLLGEEGIGRWHRFHEAVCHVPSLLGYGYHNLIIGKKSPKV